MSLAEAPTGVPMPFATRSSVDTQVLPLMIRCLDGETSLALSMQLSRGGASVRVGIAVQTSGGPVALPLNVFTASTPSAAADTGKGSLLAFTVSVAVETGSVSFELRLPSRSDRLK